MGEILNNIKAALDGKESNSTMIDQIKQINTIVKEIDKSYVRTEDGIYRTKPVSPEVHEIFENAEKLRKENAVEPDVAAKINLETEAFIEKQIEADLLLQFIRKLTENEFEINRLINETYDTIGLLMYSVNHDKSVDLNLCERESNDYIIKSEDNITDFTSSLKIMRDRFKKTYLLEDNKLY